MQKLTKELLVQWKTIHWKWLRLVWVWWYHLTSWANNLCLVCWRGRWYLAPCFWCSEQGLTGMRCILYVAKRYRILRKWMYAVLIFYWFDGSLSMKLCQMINWIVYCGQRGLDKIVVEAYILDALLTFVCSYSVTFVCSYFLNRYRIGTAKWVSEGWW